MSNLLITALNHLPVFPIYTEEDEVALPNNLHTLLLANSDPNETSRGSSPLCFALRLGNADALSLLLRFKADPNQCEVGHAEPIFIAL